MSGWHDPNVVIPLLVGAVITVLTWWSTRKATRADKTASVADAKANFALQQTSETRKDVRSVNEQLTTVASSMPPASPPDQGNPAP